MSLNALVGFWLGYSAIFANPASNINNMSTAAVAITVVVLFGIVLPPVVMVRWVMASLVCF